MGVNGTEMALNEQIKRQVRKFGLNLYLGDFLFLSETYKHYHNDQWVVNYPKFSRSSWLCCGTNECWALQLWNQGGGGQEARPVGLSGRCCVCEDCLSSPILNSVWHDCRKKNLSILVRANKVGKAVKFQGAQWP